MEPQYTARRVGSSSAMICIARTLGAPVIDPPGNAARTRSAASRSEEHTSELQSRPHLVCRLLLEKKNTRGTRFTLEDPLKKAPCKALRLNSSWKGARLTAL